MGETAAPFPAGAGGAEGATAPESLRRKDHGPNSPLESGCGRTPPKGTEAALGAAFGNSQVPHRGGRTGVAAEARPEPEVPFLWAS